MVPRLLRECWLWRDGNHIVLSSVSWQQRTESAQQASSAVMRRTYERGTKARLGLSGGPHAPVNMAGIMEDVNVSEKNAGNGKFAVLYCAIFRTPSFCKSSPRLFRSRNSPTTGILHTIRHVYRNVWLAREVKPRFGAALERSAHDYETGLCWELTRM